MMDIQKDVFRLAANRGVTHKRIHSVTGLSLSIIGQYARGETAMSGPSLFKMVGLIPDDLLSLLLPDGMFFVRASAEIDHDTLAAHCIDFAAAHARARHPESPAGVDIAPCEEEALQTHAVKLRAAK